MNPDLLPWLALAFAGVPAALCLLNLGIYRPLPVHAPVRRVPRLSVLIPARNEERNISATLESVLASRGCELEVIVLDDQSTDRTPAIVQERARRDPRLRLEFSGPLPSGWCGKQHACHLLAQSARNPWLVFIDADVRLAPDALARMAAFMERTGAALASGIPRQEMGSFLERLLLPLIHFILLGFLSMHAMRRTRWPAMSAGCGQLFIARREAYERCGGHALLRDSLHDGVKLPRVFRRAGFPTALFDATDLARCRMYRSNREVWHGLGKNATEGLAAPATILPMTAILVAGQILPFGLFPFFFAHSTAAGGIILLALVLSLLPRWIGVRRFRQPLGSAFLHPVGIALLLFIQWQAFMRHLLKKPSEWKGRRYTPAPALPPLRTT